MRSGERERERRANSSKREREREKRRGGPRAFVSRCTNENKKGEKRLVEKGEFCRESARARARPGSISVDRIPKRKRTPHLPPGIGAVPGPLTREDPGITACLCSRLEFCRDDDDDDDDEPTRKHTASRPPFLCDDFHELPTRSVS